MLGRHPLIVAAPEFDVFNHAETLSLDGLRSDLDALFERRRLSRGFKLVASFLSPGKAVGIDHATLRAWLREASSIGDFYARIAAHMCAPRSARYFVEKTPTNVYNFRALSREIPELPLIHQIRDGRDVAASLVKRGKTLFYAGSRWLYDTTAGLGARGGPRYLETRYEDLVSDPRTAAESSARASRPGLRCTHSRGRRRTRSEHVRRELAREALGKGMAEHAARSDLGVLGRALCAGVERRGSRHPPSHPSDRQRRR